MILSSVEIHRALDEGRLVIKPEPSPRFPSPGAECPYQTTSVDLHLGDEILIPSGKRPFNIDLRQASFKELLSQENYTSLKLTDAVQTYTIERNAFILAKTMEWVEFPVRDQEPVLAARVEGRSSYARCGLLVHFTAPTIHAGYRGTITLEIANFGAAGITLARRVPICQLIIEEVRGIPRENPSQFQGQTTPGGR